MQLFSWYKRDCVIQTHQELLRRKVLDIYKLLFLSKSLDCVDVCLHWKRYWFSRLLGILVRPRLDRCLFEHRPRCSFLCFGEAGRIKWQERK